MRKTVINDLTLDLIFGKCGLKEPVRFRLHVVLASQIVTHLTNEGIECVEIPQTVMHLSEAMKWVEALIVDGRLHHEGNPAFAWMISNVTAQMDRNDNVYPRKERPEKKIDGAVALIIAIGRLMSGEEKGPSIYETRGILAL